VHARPLEGVVHACFGNPYRLDDRVDGRGIDDIRCAERSRQITFGFVDVDGENRCSAAYPSCVNRRDTDTSGADDGH
jgi:hypothetical protein